MDEQQKLIETKILARQRLERSARWFYWIAGLSFINLATLTFGSNFGFVVGLGITQVLGGFVLYSTGYVQIMAVILALGVNGFFIWIGHHALKLKHWAFITGMVVYTLDGLIFVLAKDFIAVAFHGLVLYWIYQGFKILRLLNKPDSLLTKEEVSAAIRSRNPDRWEGTTWRRMLKIGGVTVVIFALAVAGLLYWLVNMVH